MPSYVLALCVVILSACGKEESRIAGNGGGIRYSVRSGVSVQAGTKAGVSFPGTEFADLANSFIGLSAAFLPEGSNNFPDGTVNTPSNYFTNRRMSRNTENPATVGGHLSPGDPLLNGLDPHPWKTYPEAFWPYSGKLSFFAYAPYQEEMTPEFTVTGFGEGYAGGWPTITFQPDQDPASQTDLLAGSTRDQDGKQLKQYYEGSNYVDLDLYHQLTWVDFQARVQKVEFSDDSEWNAWVSANGLAGSRIAVAAIHISGILKSNSGSWSSAATSFTWDTPVFTDNTTEYELSIENGTLYDVSAGGLTLDELSYTTITMGSNQNDQSTSGRLYLLPHTLDSGALLTVDYGMYVLQDGVYVPKLMYQKEFAIGGIASNEWLPGKHFIYQMTLDITKASSCYVTATMEDWVDANNNYNYGGKDHGLLE